MSINSAIKNHDVELHTLASFHFQDTLEMGGGEDKVQNSAYNTLLGVRDAPKYTKLTVVVPGRLKLGFSEWKGHLFFNGYPLVHLELFTRYMCHLIKRLKNINNCKDN